MFVFQSPSMSGKLTVAVRTLLKVIHTSPPQTGRPINETFLLVL